MKFIVMGEDECDPPIILERPFLSTVKAIIIIRTGEVHMHFPSEEGDATRGGKSSRTDGQITKEKWQGLKTYNLNRIVLRRS